MQARTNESPNRIFANFMVAQLGILAIIATGGWMLYQSAIAHIDKSAETTIELVSARLEGMEAKIEANGELIRRNAALIERNGELIRTNGERITHLRERIAAVEVRIGALDTIVRFFHPPEEDHQSEP